MRLNILFGGKAGQGINELSYIVGKTLANIGYYAFMYRDYGSLIRGGHNFNVLCVSEKPVYSHDEQYDIIVALDKNTINKHKSNLKKAGRIISEIQDIKIEFSKLAEKNKLDKKVENMILAGALLKLLDINTKEIEKIIKKEFSQLQDDNVKAVEIGASHIREKVNGKETIKLPKVKKQERKFINGSQGIGIGARVSDLDIYLGYPMTPSTPVLTYLGHEHEKHEKNGFFVYTPDSEITVINAALGASFTGARTMIGTSGGGFDLMTEALSLQGMTEIPLVVYLATRPSPSTGIPTYTSQQDLNVALKAGHGEFPRIVVAPGNPEECIEKTNEAFYLAEKYNALVIILSDKHLAESSYTLLKKPKLKKISKIKPKQTNDIFKNYQITNSGVSQRNLPGASIVKANSYEHDEYGYTTEEPEQVTRMMDKRARKMQEIRQEVKKLETCKIFGKGKKLLIGWGSTKGAILDFIAENKGYKFLQIIYLGPFPKDKVEREIKKAKQFYVVENNSTGQLASLIQEKIQIKVPFKNRILRYDGRPFTVKYLKEKLGGKK